MAKGVFTKAGYKPTAAIYPYLDRDSKRVHPFIQGLKNKSGVYIIYRGKEKVYVGFSTTDLYKTCIRHFQTWNDPSQRRVVLDRRKVKVKFILCSPAKAAELEKALILFYKPTENEEKYQAYYENENLVDYVMGFLEPKFDEQNMKDMADAELASFEK
jgi:hypothetical protein